MLAASDPTAAQTNSLARGGMAEFFVGSVTLAETIVTLDKCPIESDFAQRCAYLLQQDELRIVADAPFGIARELSNDMPPETVPTFPADSVARMRSNLTQAARGTLPRQIVDNALLALSMGVEPTQTVIREVLEGPYAERFRSYETFPEALADILPDIDLPRFLMREAVKNGVPIDEDRARFVAGRMIAFPREKPTLTGLLRANLFTNWFAARHGGMRFQDDIKTILPALCFDFVLTNDEKLWKRGRAIFPEIAWGVPPGWSPSEIVAFVRSAIN